MNLKEKLQIILITYNRKNTLKTTLDEILSENSPIKDLPITILDNASTDGTSEMVDYYCTRFRNIEHVRHNRNIGGNANICRAFEMASKEYVWVLCDDDHFDFSNWGEISNALNSNKYDMIFTINNLGIIYTLTLPILLFLSSFVPGCIYRTQNLTETCMVNMYGSINTWFPQSIFSIDILVNNKGKYFIPSKNIVIRTVVDNLDGKVLHRGQDLKKEHPDLARMYWHVGYMKALKSVVNKKQRQKLCEQVHFTQDFVQSDKEYLKFVLDYNQEYKLGNLDNYWDIFSSVSNKYKLFILYYILIGRNLPKTCILKKIIQNIFSLRNSHNKSHKIITVLGVKLKIRKAQKNKALTQGGGGANHPLI